MLVFFVFTRCSLGFCRDIFKGLFQDTLVQTFSRGTYPSLKSLSLSVEVTIECVAVGS